MKDQSFASSSTEQPSQAGNVSPSSSQGLVSQTRCHVCPTHCHAEMQTGWAGAQRTVHEAGGALGDAVQGGINTWENRFHRITGLFKLEKTFTIIKTNHSPSAALSPLTPVPPCHLCMSLKSLQCNWSAISCATKSPHFSPAFPSTFTRRSERDQHCLEF